METNQEHPVLHRAAFNQAWSRVGGTPSSSAFQSLEARYREPHRAYHNAEHIWECLSWHEKVRKLVERSDELTLALFFHDAVQAPGKADNESASASLFQQLARSAGIPGATTERVAQLIHSTADHTSAQGDAAVLSDIDLAILGSSPTRYQRYEKDIRQEYKHVPGAMYRAGRAHVLRRFLERQSIYHTPYFANRLELQARTNLLHALTVLEPGGDR